MPAPAVGALVGVDFITASHGGCHKDDLAGGVGFFARALPVDRIGTEGDVGAKADADHD